MSSGLNVTSSGDRVGVGTLIGWAREALALSALFLIVYCLVLRYIFPGYVDPFWPPHSDYFIPAAMAYSPAGFWQVLGYPRPVGQAFFWIIGHAKTRGAMAGVLFVVAINFSLIVLLMRQLFRVKASWALYAIAGLFAYLLASHPYQYQMAMWDAFAELSLFLLLLAVTLRAHGARLWMSAVLVLFAFLAKETFILSAALLATVWLAAGRFNPKSAAPLLVTAGAAMLALIEEHLVLSPFTSGDGSHGGTYEIVLNVRSVASQWFQYTIEGMNWLGVATVVITAFAVAVSFGVRSREFVWSVALPIAGLLSLLPNSVLPNHHFAGYSWNAAYLMYAPVIVAAILISRQVIARALVILVVALAICSPSLSATAFAPQNWIVTNQKHQKLFLQTLGSLVKALPDRGQKILVSGVDFPYSMFVYKQSVRSLGAPKGTQFFVIRYDSNSIPVLAETVNEHSNDIVTVIRPVDVDKTPFDQAWLFRYDGSLVRRIADPANEKAWSEDGISQKDALLYPELTDIFGPLKHDVLGTSIEYRDLACGVKFMQYNEPARAETCLRTATFLLPKNPYTHFWLGISLEEQKKKAEARTAYAAAVRLQGASPNPLFKQKLDALR